MPKINHTWRISAEARHDWALERKALQAAVNGLVAVAYVGGEKLRASDEGAIAYDCIIQLVNMGAIERGDPECKAGLYQAQRRHAEKDRGTQ